MESVDDFKFPDWINKDFLELVMRQSEDSPCLQVFSIKKKTSKKNNFIPFPRSLATM